MALNATMVKSKLAAAASNQKDDVARNIVNGATSADIKSLDIEGVLRLYEALYMLPPRNYSSADQLAMKKLATNTQFSPVTKTPDFGVKLVKLERWANRTFSRNLRPNSSPGSTLRKRVDSIGTKT